MIRYGVYQVRTIQPGTDTYTRQVGCPEYVVGLPGLRRAIRLLENMGYDARRPDAATLIQRIN